MRILMIAPQPFYAERGTPMNVRLMCEVLGKAGHRVDLLVLPTGKNIELKNVRISRLPNIFMVDAIPVGPSHIKFAYDILLAIAAFWLVLVKRYDVIHGIEEGGFLAVVLCKLFGKASVFDMDSCISEHLQYSGYLKNKFLLNLVEKIEKWSLKKSTIIITVCQALSDKARSFFPDANVYQIEDIPIANHNQTIIGHSEELIKKFDLSDFLLVVYTGNLEAYQGINLLLKSWKILCDKAKKINNYKLVIVGGTEKQIDHYKQVAAENGIIDSICWVGQRPAKEMGAWMSVSHVLVSPRSEGDNTPLKIYSYMTSGRPIVATRRKTHTQVLDDSTAFLADSKPDHFSRAIYNALSNHELSAKKAKMAKQVVEDKYSYSVFRRKLLKAYSSVMF